MGREPRHERHGIPNQMRKDRRVRSTFRSGLQLLSLVVSLACPGQSLAQAGSNDTSMRAPLEPRTSDARAVFDSTNHPASVSAAAGSGAPRSSAPPKNPRMVCGCATPRLLGRGPVHFDGGGVLAAWLHDGARLEAFTQDAGNAQRLTAVDAPLALQEFSEPGDVTTVPNSSRLVRVHATAALAPGTFLGVLRRSDVAPRDVAAVTASRASSEAPGAAPMLRALWLAPLEQRERPGCGPWLTHRLAFESVEGAPAPEAFLVSDLGARRAALVDARAAGVFGLGRLEVCAQGLPLQAGDAVELEVRPVSAAFGVGAGWRFRSDGSGTSDIVRTAIPASADASRIAEPFPVPGAEALRGGDPKRIAATVMGAVVGGVTLVAFMVWVVIPARRRRLKNVACPTCGKGVPVDTLDPKTDGFFCPACGASGFWRGEAQALPKPR